MKNIASGVFSSVGNSDNELNVTFSDSLKTIGNAAFLNCEGLYAITIPAGVSRIGHSAFAGTALQRIEFLGDAPVFGILETEDGTDHAFEGVTANGYHPAKNSTWTDGVKQTCGGSITWEAVGEEDNTMTQAEFEAAIEAAEDTYVLTKSVTITSNMTIGGGKTVTVADGAVLTLDCRGMVGISLRGSSAENVAKLELQSGAELVVNGSLKLEEHGHLIVESGAVITDHDPDSGYIIMTHNSGSYISGVRLREFVRFDIPAVSSEDVMMAFEAAEAYQSVYLMDYTEDGADYCITESCIIPANVRVAGVLTIKSGCEVINRGVITDDIIVEAGASLTNEGMIWGEMIQQGGSGEGDDSVISQAEFLQLVNQYAGTDEMLMLDKQVELTDNLVLDQNVSIMIWQGGSLTANAGLTIGENAHIVVGMNGTMTVNSSLTTRNDLAIQVTDGVLNFPEYPIAIDLAYPILLLLNDNAKINNLAKGLINVNAYIYTAEELAAQIADSTGYNKATVTVSADMALVQDITVPENMTLVISEDYDLGPACLTVPNGRTLTNDGHVTIGNGCTLLVEAGGTLVNNEEDTVAVFGTYTNNGTQINHGFIDYDNGQEPVGPSEPEVPTDPAIATLYFNNTLADRNYTIEAVSGEVIGRLPAGDKVKGYDFIGWYSEENGRGQQLSDGDTWYAGMPTTWYAFYERSEDDEKCTLTIYAQIFNEGLKDRVVMLMSQDFAAGDNMMTWLNSNEDQICQEIDSVISGYYADAAWSWNPRNYCNMSGEVLTAADLIADGNKVVYITVDLEADVPQLPSNTCGDNLTWTFDEVTDTLTISGTGTMNDYSTGERPWENWLTEIKHLVIEDGVTSISKRAFTNLESLEKITMPGELQTWNCITIPDTAPYNTLVLTGKKVAAAGAANGYMPGRNVSFVELSEGITEIELGAFYNCDKVWEVLLPDSLITIGESAFMQTNLAAIEIPENVEKIGMGAFGGCANLSRITFLGDAPAFEDYVFFNVTAEVYYPGINKTWTAAMLQNYGGNLTWNAAFDVIDSGNCGSGVTYELHQGGILIISGTGAMDNYTTANPAPWSDDVDEITELIIEDGVTTIGDNAFCNCEMLKDVSIPASIEAVGDNAFHMYHLIWFYIDQTVRQWSKVTIGADNDWFPGWDTTDFVEEAPIVASGIFGAKVFWELNEDGTLEAFGTGDMYAFGATGSYLYDLPVKNVVIGEGITSIGECAFEVAPGVVLEQTLETVTVASTVREVGIGAFRGLTALNSVTFTGDAPAFGEVSFADVTATIYYPADNATWTADIMQNYGGNLTWEAMGPVMDQEAFDALLDTSVNGDGDPYITEEIVLTDDVTLNRDRSVIIGYGGRLVVPAGVTLTVSSDFYIHGELVVEEGGNLVIENPGDQTDYSDENWLYLVLYGNAVVDGSLHISGASSFLVKRGKATFGADSVVDNYGTFAATEEESVIDLTGTLTNYFNTFALYGGQLNILETACVNNENNPVGQILAEGGTITVAGTLNNNAQMAAVNGGVMTVSGTLNNNCGLGIGFWGDTSTLEVTGTLNTAQTSEGVYVGESGELLLQNGGSISAFGIWENYGDLIISEGCEVSVGGALLNKAYLENNGILAIADNASLENYAHLVNNGTITVTAGSSLFNAKDALVENYGGIVDGETEASLAVNIKQMDSFVMIAGSSLTMEAEILPGNVTNSKIEWSVSDPALAALKTKGNTVTLKVADVTEAQNITLTAEAADGLAAADQVEITILPKVKSIAIKADKNETVLIPGQETAEPIQLTAVVAPVGAASNVTWTSSNEDVAKVSDTGLVTFTGEIGTATITATATDGSGVKASVTYKVIAPVDIHAHDGKTSIDLMAGKSATLKVLDENNKAVKNIRWSFVEDKDYSPYVTLSSSGKLTAKKISARITLQVRAEVMVDNRAVSELIYTVTIYPTTIYVDILHGENVVNGQNLYLDVAESTELTLTGQLHPVDAKEGIDWKSSNEKIATVENGVVKPVKDSEGNYKSGTVTITATAQDGSKKKATVKVQVGALTKVVNVTAPAETLTSGKRMMLTHDTGSVTPTVSGVTWAIIEGAEYAKIDAKGKLTAKTVIAPQKVVIVATSKDAAKIKSAPVTVTILPKAEENLNLLIGTENVTKATWNAEIGDTITISAMKFFNTLDDAEKWNVTWSVKGENVALSTVSGDTTVVTVNETGKATITATGYNSDGKKVTATVTIHAGTLSDGVKILSDVTTVGSGKSITLKAEAYADGKTVSNKKVVWSLAEGDEAWAKISSSGKLTATKDLTSRKTVTVRVEAQDGASAPEMIQVTITPLAQSIQLFIGKNNVTGTTLETTRMEADGIQLSAIVYPHSVDEVDADLLANQNVTWKSSNPKIVDIVNGKLVFGEKTGTVTITATAQDGSNKKATFKIKTFIPVEDLGIADAVTVVGGKTLKLSSLVNIKPGNATNKTVHYEIVKEENDGEAFATLTSSGQLKTSKVTSVKALKIQASGYKGYGTCRFMVYIRPATTFIDLTAHRNDSDPDIDVTGQTVSLTADETITIAASSCPFYPAEEGYGEQYSWKVTNAKNGGIVMEDGSLTGSTVASEITIKGVTPGKTLTVTVIAMDGSGKKATVKIAIVAAE